jgi:hypothetical protein
MNRVAILLAMASLCCAVGVAEAGKRSKRSPRERLAKRLKKKAKAAEQRIASEGLTTPQRLGSWTTRELPPVLGPKQEALIVSAHQARADSLFLRAKGLSRQNQQIRTIVARERARLKQSLRDDPGNPDLQAREADLEEALSGARALQKRASKLRRKARTHSRQAREARSRLRTAEVTETLSSELREALTPSNVEAFDELYRLTIDSAGALSSYAGENRHGEAINSHFLRHKPGELEAAAKQFEASFDNAHVATRLTRDRDGKILDRVEMAKRINALMPPSLERQNHRPGYERHPQDASLPSWEATLPAPDWSR